VGASEALSVARAAGRKHPKPFQPYTLTPEHFVPQSRRIQCRSPRSTSGTARVARALPATRTPRQAFHAAGSPRRPDDVRHHGPEAKRKALAKNRILNEPDSFSKDEDESIAKTYLAGASLLSVAKQHHTSICTVRNVSHVPAQLRDHEERRPVYRTLSRRRTRTRRSDGKKCIEGEVAGEDWTSLQETRERIRQILALRGVKRTDRPVTPIIDTLVEQFAAR